MGKVSSRATPAGETRGERACAGGDEGLPTRHRSSKPFSPVGVSRRLRRLVGLHPETRRGAWV